MRATGVSFPYNTCHRPTACHTPPRTEPGTQHTGDRGLTSHFPHPPHPPQLFSPRMLVTSSQNRKAKGKPRYYPIHLNTLCTVSDYYCFLQRLGRSKLLCTRSISSTPLYKTLPVYRDRHNACTCLPTFLGACYWYCRETLAGWRDVVTTTQPPSPVQPIIVLTYGLGY